VKVLAVLDLRLVRPLAKSFFLLLEMKTYSVFIYPVLKKVSRFQKYNTLSAKSILQFFTAILVPKLNYLFPSSLKM